MTEKPDLIPPLKSIQELPELMVRLAREGSHETLRAKLVDMQADAHEHGHKFTVAEINWAIALYSEKSNSEPKRGS
jgi:hypothetical protein